MWDVRACTVCLSNNVKLSNMDNDDLRAMFNLVSGLQTNIGDGLPRYLCMECCGFVKKSKKFRDKCQRANFALQEILYCKKQITLSSLKAIDRESIGIAPVLARKEIEKASIIDNVIFEWKPETHEGNNPVTYDENKIKEEKQEPKVSETIQEFVQRFTDDIDIDDGLQNGDDGFDHGAIENVIEVEKLEIDEDKIEEEYAIIMPISIQEARAAYEIEKLRTPPREGDDVCEDCGKVYRKGGQNYALFIKHKELHDHFKGSYSCEICKYYYKHQHLLDAHMNSYHNFKYICTVCLEVNFDRISAKNHYIQKHMDRKTQARPSWLRKKDTKKKKVRDKNYPVGKWKKLARAPDFPVYTPITHEEQYLFIQERKNSRNYIESQYKCDLCFKGFRSKFTYDRHLVKHDPSKSGPLRCDVCHFHFQDTRSAYNHMVHFHTRRYSCRMCDYVSHNLTQAMGHYKWHKNVTFKCHFCEKVFNKMSTCLTHVRVKHPSNHLCRLCGHSYVSESGLHNHVKKCHTDEELKQLAAMEANPDTTLYCKDCKVQFVDDEAFNTHFGSSNKHALTNVSSVKRDIAYKKTTLQNKGGKRKRVTCSDVVNTGRAIATACGLCGLELVNDTQAKKHYDTMHPGEDYLKRYMCDVCGHTTKQYANLVVHMRKHTMERPFKCPYCERRFSMASNRDRHIFVHTGEKRYECQHCSRRFSQSSAVKLHVQTVHLKIPYAPWDKANRKRKQRRKKMDVNSTFAEENIIPEMQAENPEYMAGYMSEYV